MFGDFKIPAFIVFQVLSSIVVGFTIWQQRKKYNLKDEKIFDFILLYIFSSIICGRLFYIIENFGDFGNVSWSIYPFYYEPGAERVWFRQMPWILIKFWDNGIIPSGMLFGGVVYAILFYKRNRLTNKFSSLLVRALCYGQLILILGFFLSTEYVGKTTDLWIGVRYVKVDDSLRVPIQLFEIAVLLILLILIHYLKKLKKDKGILGIYFFLLGWLEVIVQFLIDRGDHVGGINAVQVAYLILVFIGILISVFAFQQDFVVDTKERGVLHTTLENNKGHSLDTRMQFGYRDFKSSFSDYNRGSPSFTGWLKKKYRDFKRKLSAKQDDNGREL